MIKVLGWDIAIGYHIHLPVPQMDLTEIPIYDNEYQPGLQELSKQLFILLLMSMVKKQETYATWFNISTCPAPKTTYKGDERSAAFLL